MGAAESAGFWYEGSMSGTKGTPYGFLGMRGTLQEMRASGDPFARAWTGATKDGQSRVSAVAKTYQSQMSKHFMPGSVYSTGMRAGMGRLGAGRAAMSNAMRATGASSAMKFAGKTAFRSLGLVGTAALMYSGYQEGGILGAARGGAESVAFSFAMRAGLGLIGPAAYAAIPAAAGYGMYQFGEAAREHVKNLKQLEFGGSQIMDALGSAGAATSRQRSVMALQNTHLNGRMAMGNEALLMHTSFR